MPTLPQSINGFTYYFNPIWENQRQIIDNPVPYDQDSVLITIKQINTYNSFHHLYFHLYYSLKFKNQFRNWLWEKVRKPKIEQKYHPNYLIQKLNENTDLDIVLINW